MEKQSANEKVKQVYLDYLKVFGTPEGKRVLHDMMKAGHMLAPSYVAGDPYGTALREGERKSVLRILGLLKTNITKLNELFKSMDEENQE